MVSAASRLGSSLHTYSTHATLATPTFFHGAHTLSPYFYAFKIAELQTLLVGAFNAQIGSHLIAIDRYLVTSVCFVVITTALELSGKLEFISPG
jgi:hypothetical protein